MEKLNWGAVATKASANPLRALELGNLQCCLELNELGLYPLTEQSLKWTTHGGHESNSAKLAANTCSSPEGLGIWTVHPSITTALKLEIGPCVIY